MASAGENYNSPSHLVCYAFTENDPFLKNESHLPQIFEPSQKKKSV